MSWHNANYLQLPVQAKYVIFSCMIRPQPSLWWRRGVTCFWNTSRLTGDFEFCNDKGHSPSLPWSRAISCDIKLRPCQAGAPPRFYDWGGGGPTWQCITSYRLEQHAKTKGAMFKKYIINPLNSAPISPVFVMGVFLEGLAQFKILM